MQLMPAQENLINKMFYAELWWHMPLIQIMNESESIRISRKENKEYINDMGWWKLIDDNKQ